MLQNESKNNMLNSRIARTLIKKENMENFNNQWFPFNSEEIKYKTSLGK